MSFIQENLQIFSTLGSALALYTFIRISASKESNQIIQRLDKIEAKIENLEDKLQIIDSRVSRIEGQLMPSPWEAKVKEKK